jgi:hypothetical protein
MRWRVEPGVARRGDAWTDVAGCAMRVPFDGGAHGRVVRAHELMHARVSPTSPRAFDAWDGIAPRSLECAEELRVNQLLARVGFDVRDLRDGSERLTGQRLTEAAEWEELARFAAAVAGTRALSDLLAGVRRVAPSWATQLRALERELLRYLRGVPTASLAATTPSGELPEGFARHTRALGALIERHVGRGGATSRGTPRRARPPATGAFASLVLDGSVRLDRAVPGAVLRRRTLAVTGRRVARPDRLLTDPARRLFTRPAVARGGVVVVDQSGSMALSDAELESLLDAAPGAFVLGYSHAPGTDGEPNAWVLADRGRVASRVRPGNVGNGVDGPALRLGLARRRAREPVVWVCDGQVTDSGDHADPGLAAECARLVLRHGVAMVASPADARDALRSRRRGPRLLGRVAAAVTPRP